MRNTDRYRTGIAALALLLALAGCGRAKTASGVKKAEDALQTSPPAEALGVAVYSSDEKDMNRPSATDPIPNRVLAQDSVIEFQDTYRWSGHPLYVAWGGELRGSPITDAYFTVEIDDQYNRKKADYARANAHWDPDSKRWFIPLAEALGGRPENVGSSDRILIGLELHFTGEANQYYTVKLMLGGPMPKVSVAPSVLPLIDRPEQAQEVSKEGWVFAEQMYRNDSPRELMLWASTLLEKPRSKALLDHTYYNMPWDQRHSMYLSEAPLDKLEISASRVKEDGTLGEPKAVLITNSHWTSIPLHPYEALVLKWVAKPDESIKKCGVPAPNNHSIDWDDQEVCSHGGRGGDVNSGCHRDHHHQDVSEPWAMTAYAVSGNLHYLQVRVTDAFSSLEDLLSSDPVVQAGSAAVYEQGLTPPDASFSAIPSSAQPFDCQGVF